MAKEQDVHAHEVRPGMRARFFDPFSAESLEANSRRSSPGVMINYGKRFCGACQSLKPKGKRKATKAWRCDDCRSAAVVKS